MKYLETTFTITGPAECLNDARDLLAALAGEAGYETFEETPTGLKGYVQASIYNNVSLDEALADFPFDKMTISYETREAEDRDWNETWEQQGFEPIVVGSRCAIHDGRHLPTQPTDISLEIDAHMAFGTGNHETTRMVLATLLDLDLTGKRLLDAGCGTGILGIAALKAGAQWATGYDIDEWSADNARHNAVINGVDAHYEALLGDSSVIGSITGKYDIVVANIFREILLADLPRFADALADGGTLIISGFYEADVAPLTEAARKLGLTPTTVKTSNEWACIALKR